VRYKLTNNRVTLNYFIFIQDKYLTLNLRDTFSVDKVEFETTSE